MKKGWISNRLGAITTKIGSGATPRGGEGSYKETGTPLIRSMNVHDWGFKEAKLVSRKIQIVG
jgi:type I restriction enzyme S subunit